MPSAMSRTCCGARIMSSARTRTAAAGTFMCARSCCRPCRTICATTRTARRTSSGSVPDCAARWRPAIAAASCTATSSRATSLSAAATSTSRSRISSATSEWRSFPPWTTRMISWRPRCCAARRSRPRATSIPWAWCSTGRSTSGASRSCRCRRRRWRRLTSPSRASSVCAATRCPSRCTAARR